MKTIILKVETKGDVTLTTLAKYKNGILLPTPTASNYKGGATRTDPKRQNDTLAHHIHGMSGEPGKTSQLNPRFVAEMMGFPVNWTELPFQNGEMKV